MAPVRHIIVICPLSLLFAARVSAFEPTEFVREIGETVKQATQRQFNTPRTLAVHGPARTEWYRA
jgi:hypothetical protein